MKKKKSLLLASLSLVSAFTCACAFGCSQANPDDEVLKGNYEGAADVVEDAADNWVLQSIAVETTGLKTEYNYGEEFEQTKPVVKATFATLESVIKVEENKLNESSAIRLETEERVLSAEDVKVDFGQYDKNSVGTYNIYVSYTHAGVTRMASYTVTVKSINPSIGGITAHTENFVDTYYIENEAGVNVSLEGLYFLNVDAEQNIDYDNPIQPATEENPDGYKLTYYAGGTVIESLEGLQKGEYTVMASYNGAKAFVIISVLDPVASVVIKPETENAKFEQVQSPVDELTSTWQFTVTYASGLTKTVKKGDEGVIIGNIVTVTAASRATTMSYTEDNETVSVSVPYTITADPGLVEGVNSMSISALTDINASPLLPSHMTGDNAFITPLGKLRHRTGNNASFVDFNGEALTVTTNGFGSLEIAVRSTGGANVSGFYLADEEGKYISGVFEAGTGISEVQLSGGTAYLVTDAVSTSFKTITFILPKAGTYKLGSLATGSAGVTQSYTRMNKLVLTDVFDNTIDRTSYEFAIDTTNVKKDYIAGQTAADLSKEGLTAVLKEIHTVDTDKNTQTSVTAENLSITLTDGDMSKLNSTGTVTVTYTAEGGKEYTATYTINIKSPVTGVNSVALTKETLLYNLESAEAETVAISTDDIVIHKNGATGEVITLGDGESITYKLFDKDGNELDGLNAKLGTNTLKATVVLKNTEAAVEGTTTFTAEIDIEVEAWVDPGAAVQTKTVTYTSDADPAADSIVKANKNDKVITVTATKLYAVTGNNATKFETDSAFHLQKSNESVVTVVINGCMEGTASITIEFFHTNSSTQRQLAVYKDAYSAEATPLKVSEKVSNAELNTFVIDNLSDGTYVITSGDDNTGAATTVYAKSVTVKYDYEVTGDEVDYTFDIDTTNVKKDYIAGETVLSKDGLTATLVENHSVNTSDNKTHDITAEDLTIEVTSGSLTAINSTAIVIVTYTHEGTPYTKNYIINVKSPVTGVNSVALTKETASYRLESTTAETVEISKDDIVIHKNTAAGDAITLGEGESVTYELFNGDQKLDTWTVGVGQYTIKATVTLNNTEAAVAGTTEFTATISVSVGEYVAPGTKTAYSVLYKFDGAGGIGTATWEDNVDGSVANNVAIKITTDTNKVEAKSFNGIDFVGYSQVNASNKNITVKLAEGVTSAKITVYFRNSSGKTTVRTLSIYNASDSVASWSAGTESDKTSDAPGTDVTALENVSIEANTEYTIKGDNSLYVYGIAISYEA